MNHQLRIFTGARSDKKRFDAYFALELISLSPPDENLCKYPFSRSAAFVRARYRPELDASLEIRAVRGTDWGPHLVIRGRVSHSDCVEAAVVARPLYEALCSELEVLFPNLQWKPVLTDERYQLLFGLPENATVCEILRESGLQRALCAMSDTPAIVAAGPEDDRPATGDIWTLNKFRFRPEPWNAALAYLSARHEAAVISATIAPVRLEERERQFLLGQISACASTVAMDLFNDGAHAAEKALKDSELMVKEFSDSAFLLSLRTAASGRSSDFAQSVGALFCASAGCASEWDASQAQVSGGFKIHVFQPGDADIASENLRHAAFSVLPSSPVMPWSRLAMTASITELAGIFTFPGAAGGRCPAIICNSSKTAPLTGATPSEGIMLGRAQVAGARKPVFVNSTDLGKHLITWGSTGSGKTNGLYHIAMQIIRAGEGIGIIVPDGDLSAQVLKAIPEAFKDKVIYINLGDPKNELRLNLLKHDGPVDGDMVINHLMEIFRRLYHSETMGPIFELNMRTGLKTIMASPSATLGDLPRVFTDKVFREALVAKLKLTEPHIAESWKYFDEATGEMSPRSVAPYVISKINMFTLSSVIRPIISAPESNIDFEAIMNGKKILIINLAKNVIGKINAAFMGMIFADMILRTALKRGAGTRQPAFSLIIDELHTLATPSFAEMLSEARKYKLTTILADQFIKQIPADIHHAIMENAGTIIAYRSGAEDAAMLEPYFSPIFTAQDLMTLPVGKACASIISGGVKLEPFSLFIDPPDAPQAAAPKSSAQEPNSGSGSGHQAVAQPAKARKARRGQKGKPAI